jgi:hypothetical protein
MNDVCNALIKMGLIGELDLGGTTVFYLLFSVFCFLFFVFFFEDIFNRIQRTKFNKLA